MPCNPATEDGREWIDVLEDDSEQASVGVEHAHDTAQLREWLLSALQGLSDRERFIVRERKLRADPRTLESLGDEFGAFERAGAPVGSSRIPEDAQEP